MCLNANKDITTYLPTFALSKFLYANYKPVSFSQLFNFSFSFILIYENI